MRHKILPDGGTFRTVDEPFITSTGSDIHLTDVLQDADGSLLVVNTGGWFITGCPLSRVAKLDVHGAFTEYVKMALINLPIPGEAGLISNPFPEIVL